MSDTRRVLVVDDTLFFRKALADLLREDGWEVFEAAGGREGVTEALRHGANLDLILVDLQMPEMDGFEVLRRLQNDARGRKMRALAMTADHPDLDQMDVLRSLGARGFVDKTLPMPELLERIRLSSGQVQT